MAISGIAGVKMASGITWGYLNLLLALAQESKISLSSVLKGHRFSTIKNSGLQKRSQSMIKVSNIDATEVTRVVLN